jgi:hypothetical protein
MLQIKRPRKHPTLAGRRRRSRNPRQQSRYPLRIIVETRKAPTKIFLFRSNRRGINQRKQKRQRKHDPPIPRRPRKPKSNQHRPQVQRIPRMRIWPGHRQFRILLHIPRSISPQPNPWPYHPQTPRQRKPRRPRQPQKKPRDHKPQRHSNPPRNPAPVTGHFYIRSCNNPSAASITASGVIVNNPASGSRFRLWSRLLSGCRNTRNSHPNGPFRAGSVGPKIPTTGLPSAHARCSGPVSPAIVNEHRRVNSINSPSSGVTPTAAPPLEATNSDANPTSSGPAFTTTPSPRAASSCATAPYRAAGHRLAPHPAPGLISTNGSRTRPIRIESHQALGPVSQGSNGEITGSDSPATTFKTSTACSIT